MDILQRIQRLPDVLIDIIQTYLPLDTIVWITRKNYLNNHKYLIINKNMFDNYTRDMIRNDRWFILEQILEENYNKWLKPKYKYKYKYKNVIYHNYIDFLTAFCIENHSTNCKNIISIFLEEHGISKNQHKNNTFINIRWKS